MSAESGAPLGTQHSALRTRLAELAGAVDEHVQALLDAAAAPAGLDGMLRYHLGWVDERFQPVAAARGKRLRPALCLLACEAAGGHWRAALPSAAAVELIHNFSLIHDDIEDASPLRRHRPTLWAVWGVARAINAGDALCIQAQLAVLGGGGPPSDRLAAARLLNRACAELCAGQHRDLEMAGAAQPTLADYYAMIGGKTAALLAAAAELGALAAGSPPDVQAAYGRFGREVGLAFQLQDDLLDVWGAAARTGKPAREDLRARKHSLPIALAFECAPSEARARLAAVYPQPAPLAEQTVDAIVALLDALGVRAEGERLVRHHHEAALGALAAARPRAGTGELLLALAESLIGREA